MKWRLRGAVKRAQAEMNTTMVYVTHDQTEALTFADEVSVLHGGRLLQTGTPQELYEKPAHAEVARFIGNPGMNLLPAEIVNGKLSLNGQVVSEVDVRLPQGKLQVGFRPEWAQLVDRQQVAGVQSSGLSVPVTLNSTRLIGAEADKALGVARITLGSDTAQVVCELGPELEKPLALQLSRYELFCDGLRLTQDAES